MIRISNTLSVCYRGHKLSSQRTSCAHCDGYTDAEFKEASRGLHMQVLVNKPEKVFILERGVKIPYDRADIVNGLHKEVLIPEGWYVYYIKFKLEGQELYKIGISQAPWSRLKELAPELLWFEYRGKQEDAYREEQRLLRLHSAHKLRVHMKKLSHKGGSEVFTRDILNKGLDIHVKSC